MAIEPKNSARERVDAVVTVSDGEIPRIHTLAKKLAAKGLDVSHVLESSGLIAGTLRPDAFEAIRAVKGVDALEAAGKVDIGPPGADIQ